MKLKKRLSLLLALVMIVSLIPVVAWNTFAAAATDPVIRTVTAFTVGTTSAYSPRVYFGNGKIWSVVAYKNGSTQIRPDDFSLPNGVVMLVSRNSYGTTTYGTTASYADSQLKVKMEEIVSNNFSDLEAAAITARNFAGSTTTGQWNAGVVGATVTGAKLWPLCWHEVKSLPAASGYRYLSTTAVAWLRDSSDGTTMGTAGTSAARSGKATTEEAYVRPGMYLNLNSILLVSSVGGAEGRGGKYNGANGLTAIEAGTTDTLNFKLTLLDSARSAFTAATTAVNGRALTITYSGATTGEKEYVSAIIQNNTTGNFSHYGRIKNVKQATDAAGTVTVTLPEGFDMTGKTLYIFNEQYNSDQYDRNGLTDYASKFVPVTTTALTAPYGTATLGNVTLPTGWTWADDTTVVGNAGTKTFAATYGSAYEAVKCVTSVNLPVNVTKATPTYTVPTGLTATYGQTLGNVTLPAGWTWDNPTASVGNVGTNTFKATFTPADADNYETVTDIDVQVAVGKATPTYTVPTGLTAKYGQTLNDVTLPAGWTWQDAATTSVGNIGTNTFKATFTPADEANYQTILDVDVTVTVGKADQTKPTVTAVAESAENAKDGKITGVTDKMEYRLQGATTWTAVTGTEITALAPGKYEVRLKETDTQNASEAALVVVVEAGHEHGFGTEWKSDANGHWNECACGEKGNAAAHDPEVKNAKPATADAPGYTGDKVCKICGYEIEKGTDIPYQAEGNNGTGTGTGAGTGTGTTVPENPKTGDNALALCVALLLVSCFGIAGAAYFGKKYIIK